ncbi:MAG TPA: thiosulfate oxidation carrier protein SoxY [Paracoccaceae bacterium]|nr:thiosulfate oxidation carrier protein SoxY [Paracoccaceae bacterium]HMO72780.1 thiosulfate oxidation carrier protein SoxY [Paracoccaceae bacterium]
MRHSRRNVLVVGIGGFAAAALPAAPARAAVGDAMAAFAGGATVADGGITLSAPEIAENGNAVPIGITAPGAVAIALFAGGNPEPLVTEVTFGPAAGSQALATRIRLAQSQEVIALARMADGSVVRARAEVKVTIGGCGG